MPNSTIKKFSQLATERKRWLPSKVLSIVENVCQGNTEFIYKNVKDYGYDSVAINFTIPRAKLFFSIFQEPDFYNSEIGEELPCIDAIPSIDDYLENFCIDDVVVETIEVYLSHDPKIKIRFCSKSEFKEAFLNNNLIDNTDHGGFYNYVETNIEDLKKELKSYTKYYVSDENRTITMRLGFFE